MSALYATINSKSVPVKGSTMELREAYDLDKWIKEEITSREVMQKYSALQQALQQNFKRNQNQPPIPFNEQKEALLKALTNVSTYGLSNPQLRVLENLEISKHVGKTSSDNIRVLMTENAADLGHLAAEIQKYQTELQEGIKKITGISTALETIISTKEMKLPEDMILTRVTFQNDASINDINDLKTWTNRLHTISRGMAVACNQPVESIKVEGASKGSLVFTLVIGRYIASVLTKTIKEVLECMSEYQNFKIKAHEAELAALKKDRFEQDYLEDQQRWEERATRAKRQIIDDLTEQRKEDIEAFNDNHQAELRSSIKDLVELISKGGDVDPVIPPVELMAEGEDEGAGNVDLNQLRQDYVRLTELKENLRIEHIADFDDGIDN